MDLKIVLLCLGVLCCVQSFQAEIVPPLVPMSFTNAGYPLFNTDLGHYPGVIYPVSKWMLRQWIYVTSVDPTNADLLAMLDPNVFIYLSSGGLLKFQAMGDEHNSNTAVLVLSKWMYFATGMNGSGNAFAYFKYRAAAPLYATLVQSPTLTTISVYQGSDDAISFYVRN